jgi:hypothetical protein
MRLLKVHFAEDYKTRFGLIRQVVCSQSHIGKLRITTDTSKVTCKKCLEYIEEKKNEKEEVVPGDEEIQTINWSRGEDQ